VTRPASLDSRVLRRAFERIVARHPALRTTYFLHRDGEPRQRVADSGKLDFEEVDGRGWDEPKTRSWVADEAHRPFDLEHGPVLRVRLLRALDTPILLIAVHHIAIDGWSLYVLLEELDQLYAQETGLPAQPPAPPDPFDYQKYVKWQAELLQ